MEDKIRIIKSPNADTRSAKGNVSKEELLDQTLSHILDVQNVGCMLADKLKEQVAMHDHTKIDYIDDFYNDFVSGKQVPEDVNLIDVLEMVIDCTVAGLARSGNVYDITIPDDVLIKAINNTKDLIINSVKVVDNIID